MGGRNEGKKGGKEGLGRNEGRLITFICLSVEKIFYPQGALLPLEALLTYVILERGPQDSSSHPIHTATSINPPDITPTPTPSSNISTHQGS